MLRTNAGRNVLPSLSVWTAPQEALQRVFMCVAGLARSGLAVPASLERQRREEPGVQGWGCREYFKEGMLRLRGWRLVKGRLRPDLASLL